MLKCSALIPVSLLKLLMEIYNLHSSLTTPFCWGLLPGSIKSNPHGLKMCFLLPLIVICLFIIRQDKFWLREILIAVNNVIKNKSEVPALHRADLHGASCAGVPACHRCSGGGMGMGSRPGTARSRPTIAPLWIHRFLPRFMSLTPIVAAAGGGLLHPGCGVLQGQEVAHDLGRLLSPRSLEAFRPVLLLLAERQSSPHFGDLGSHLRVHSTLPTRSNSRADLRRWWDITHLCL